MPGGIKYMPRRHKVHAETAGGIMPGKWGKLFPQAKRADG